MENASKALLMAGGVFLTLLVVSLLMYAWNMYSDYQNEQDRLQMIEDTAKFNQQFTNYDRDDVYGYDVLSLVNKAIDYNQRLSEEGANIKSAAGNTASYKPIDIEVYIPNQSNGVELTSFRKEVQIPDGEKVDSRDRSNNYVFEYGHNYGLWNEKGHKTKRDRNLDNIVEEMTEYESEKNSSGVINPLGGTVGIQNLVKNVDTIYGSRVIRVNTGTPSNDWYEANYIVSRYKTLTGVQPGNSTGTTPEEKKINWIRNKDNIKKVLRYYEYTYFKKASFKCTNVQYDADTGRVVLMNFEYKGIQ
ncbi:MAG: hypothetical protein HFJ17_04685 [Clostridia bacterium]|nr:hypothetical protein [Clostridia bacterium]